MQPLRSLLVTGSDELTRVLGLLRRATRDRRSSLRNVSLATVEASGGPRLRTLVLRGVGEGGETFDFWTDTRSSKVSEIAANPRVALLFWDGRSIQLRAEGRATIAAARDDESVARTLASLQDHALTDYASRSGPGGAPAGEAADLRAEASRFFARIRVETERMDLLLLAREGHRRWLFEVCGECREVQP